MLFRSGGKTKADVKTDQPQKATEEEKQSAVDNLKNILTTDKESRGRGKTDKKPVSNPRGQTEERLKYVDVGEKIGGARKDLAALVKMYYENKEQAVTMTDLQSLEEAGEAGVLITRERQFGGKKAIVNMMKAIGADSSTTYVVYRLISSIEKQPKDDVKSRELYMMGVDRLLKMFGTWTDTSHAKDGLEVIMNELTGYYQTPEEIRMIQNLKEKQQEIKNQFNQIWRSDYVDNPKYWSSKRFNNSRASDDFWKEPRIVELKKENSKFQQGIADIRSDGKKRSDADPNSPKKIFSSLGASFLKTIGDQYSKKWEKLVDQANGKNDWKWAGLEESEGEKKERKKRDNKTMKWERFVPDDVDRVSQASEKDYESKTIMEDFGIRAVEYGNWMDIESSKIHTQRAGEALTDMAFIFGIDKSLISLNGRLALAFGARGKGKASAHYEPAKKVINMTKLAGGGSLAHEWGHALDNILSLVSYKEAGVSGGQLTFLSDSGYENKHSHLLATAGDALRELREALSTGGNVPTVNININKPQNERRTYYASEYKDNAIRNFLGHERDSDHSEETSDIFWKELSHEDFNRFIQEKANQYFKNRKESIANDMQDGWYKNYYARFTDREWRTKDTKTANNFRKEVEYYISKWHEHGHGDQPISIKAESVRPATTGVSDYLATAEKMGGYWARPHEVFARAFESYVSDKLEEKGMKNSYLVSGVQESYADKFASDSDILPEGKTSIYPRGQERKRINAAFDKLMEGIKEHEILKKAISILDMMDLRKAIDFQGIPI